LVLVGTSELVGAFVSANQAYLKTALHAAHVAAGARMVGFAGYDMPVQYPSGVLAEHEWTRSKAGLFDVSHMGQAWIVAADGAHETAARALEALVPADVLGLQFGQQRYSQLLADDGGILDDLMVWRPADPRQAGTLGIIVNAACKDADFVHIAANLPNGVGLVPVPDAALMALQGPMAAEVLAASFPQVASMPFMSVLTDQTPVSVQISRSGYTGEDGFEISCAATDAMALWHALLADDRVRPIGLGARDSLRLEGGLCLYGHDIDTTTSPVEAGLTWSIQKRRRLEGGFPGGQRILRELEDGPARKRVGILPDGRAPAREGTDIQDETGRTIGIVTSGGFGPTVGAPISMGYVETAYAKPEIPVQLIVRGKAMPARIAALPFVPNRFYRG
jgi:aminomethyltransferase